MNLSNRVTKMESATVQLQIKQFIRNIGKISNSQINNLWELLTNERQNRGIVERAEIVAARHLYQQLTEEGTEPEEAAQLVIEAARRFGFELTEDDFIDAETIG